jgi:putative ABC transport system ATP-binding protein
MIALHGLGLHYPQGPHLVFADTTVPSGHTLVLRGDSGSGKSSLLALLAGLLKPTQGQLTVAGVNPHALGASQRDAWRGAHIGLLPQRALLSPHLSVWQHLALPFVCTSQAVNHGAIEQLLSALGLSDLADRPAHSLSGGQAQRVALGRALVRRPAVLLADEPTASLDDRHTAQVLDLLQAHARQATLVIATHDARVIQHLTGPQVHTLTLQPHGSAA